MRNVFGSGLGSSGNFDYEDPGGFNDNPLKRAFSGLDETPDDSGFNQRMMRRAMTPAFSDYSVDSPDEINRRQSSLRQYETGPATKAYLDYAGQAPSRDDYQPGKMRSLMAALVGGATGYKNPAGGMKVAEDIRDDPYNEAYGDYSNKLKAMHDAATIESQNENYAALSGYRNYGAETGGMRQAETARSNQAKEGIASNWNLARVDQFGKTNAQKVSDAQEKKREFGITSSEKGRHDIETEKTGNRNAASGEVRAGASVTSANAAAVNATTGQAREKTYESDVQGKNEARKNPKTTNKGPSPAEINNAMKSAAAQLRAENPDKYGDLADKYGNMTPATGFFGGAKATPASTEFVNAVKARHQEILRQKYPNYNIGGTTAPAASSDKVDGTVDY
jgi:hypothetical protein